MSLPDDILQKMLDAAKTAAGAQWTTFSDDIRTFSQNLLDDGKNIADNLRIGRISEAEAKVELDAVSDEADMIANYTTESVKIAAQNAVNAAVGALWEAIKAAVP